MSAESEAKNETEAKLMADNDNDKNYGTDDRVILTVGEQPSTHQQNNPEVGEGDKQMTRKPTIIKRMRTFQATDSHIGFLEKIVSFIFNTVAGIIALAITNCVQIACIVIGSVYINDCPVAPGIPIILIVNGVINVIVCIMEGIRRRINPDSNILPKFNIIMTGLKLASFIAFIAWIFFVFDHESPDFEDSTDGKFCDRTLYLFAFWLLNVILILFGIVLFITCCCCCLATKAILGAD